MNGADVTRDVLTSQYNSNDARPALSTWWPGEQLGVARNSSLCDPEADEAPGTSAAKRRTSCPTSRGVPATSPVIRVKRFAPAAPLLLLLHRRSAGTAREPIREPHSVT
ncbi:unnamed protein product [Lampetra fluviatilis]